VKSFGVSIFLGKKRKTRIKRKRNNRRQKRQNLRKKPPLTNWARKILGDPVPQAILMKLVVAFQNFYYVLAFVFLKANMASVL